MWCSGGDDGEGLKSRMIPKDKARLFMGNIGHLKVAAGKIGT